MSFPLLSPRVLKSNPWSFLIVQSVVMAFYAGLLLTSAHAATPTSGSISAGATAPVTWTGTASGTGSANEGTCQETITCDTFTLTVSGVPSDYVGKLIAVKIQWTVSTNDYDLYIHKGSLSGPVVASSADGAPQTSEAASIDPSSTGTGTYTVHVVYFATTPLLDQYQGSATVAAKPISRSATYLQGTFGFSTNTRLKAPVARRDGEPSSRTDNLGNAYVGAIRGVPAGVDLWYFDLNPGSATYDPFMRTPIYRGQPDSFTDTTAEAVGADGGGDIDIAVGLPDPVSGVYNNPPTIAASSLVAANISTQRSTDKGVTFTKNPLGNGTGGVLADDRQWLAFYGSNTVYLLYRTLEPAETMIQRSIDGGLTYGPATTAGAIGQVGAIDVDQNDGTVYISGSSGKVCVGKPLVPGQAPLTYTCTQAASDPNGVAHIFFVVKVAPDGTAYVVYSNDHDIFLAHSTDKGQTWSSPVRVSNGPETITSVLPHIGLGKAPGSVGIVWYGTSDPANDNNADWNVFFAQSFNATAVSPTFTQVQASDHVIHGSNISEGGLTGTANRNLIDYFQVSFDPTGAAVIGYADDHNDFDGHTYVTRQTSGTGINGTAIPSRKAPKPVALSSSAPQVTDFAQDVQIGLLGVVPVNDPLDILSVKYSCEDPGAGTLSSNPMLVTTMKVSDLSSIPDVSNWRTSFAANVPNSVVSPNGDYSFGTSDRGDQFYFRASSDPSQISTFSFGTAVRNSDGSLTYTRRGAANSGLFDAAAGTITVKVALSPLNQFLPLGHPQFASGVVLAGLRGQTFTAGANAKTDIARGGTQYTLQCSAPSKKSGGNGGGFGGGDGNGNVVKVTGGGELDGKNERFKIEADNGFTASLPSGQILYADNVANFEMVSDSIDTFTQNGNNEVQLTGRGHIGGTSVTFTVRLQDNGEPGTYDFFSIVIPGYPAHQGTLTEGNIQFHR